MCKRLAVAFAFAALVFSGCASTLQKGDEAFARRDWDRAVELYVTALRSDLEPGEWAKVQSRLDEARNKSGETHGQRSAQLEAAGNLEEACNEAELAFRFAPSDATGARVGAVKAALGSRLLTLGKASYEAGQLESAVQQLGRAQELTPSAEGQALLVKAQAAAEEARSRAFEAAVASASQAMTVRDWREAVRHFDVAHRAKSNEDSLRKAAFCTAMLEAETAAASRNQGAARSSFEEALRIGLDSDHVRSRMHALLPFDYKITLHEGVVLPFKPDTQAPWDGLGSKRVEQAADIMSALSLFSGGQSAIVGQAGEVVVGRIQSQVEPPDTYLVVTYGDKALGSRDQAQEDSYRPAWQLSFMLHGCPSDEGTVSFTVLDRDLEQDDRVGAFQLSMSELLSETGVKELYFVTKDGELRAGGLVGLRLSVQRK
jgi:tetratricopeptide (TPR) repeat protein